MGRRHGADQGGSPDNGARRQIRAVLLVGFGLVLVLWVASGVDLVRRISDVEKTASDVSARFNRRDELLGTVRMEVQRGSIFVRDALLDVPGTADYYRGELGQAETSTNRALEQYDALIDSPDERRTFDQMRTEVREYWQALLPVVSWDTGQRATRARDVLRESIIPRRRTVISISNRVLALNRDAYEEQQAQVAGIYATMRRRVWQTSIAVLALGIAVSLFAIRYAGRLEGRIQRQRLRERENARDLQRLSTKLVHAQEEERRSIARELHDEIGQALTAIKVELVMVERTIEPEARTRNVFGEARAITDHALQTVRDLSQLLHPPLLDDMGLPATLEWYLRGFATRTGIATDLVQQGVEARLTAEIEVCLYRIAQEALTNVARHAGARSCRVYLQRLPQTVLLTVEDDGNGFDVRQATASQSRQGMGLLGIQERAAGFGGTFRLESTPGKGTRLTVEVPALPPSHDDEKAASEVEQVPGSAGQQGVQ